MSGRQNRIWKVDVRSEAGTLQTLNTVPHNKSPPSWPGPWWGPALLMDYLYIFNSAPPHVGTRCNHVNITHQHITWPILSARAQNKVKMIPEILIDRVCYNHREK